jgi:predicted aconitase
VENYSIEESKVVGRPRAWIGVGGGIYCKIGVEGSTTTVRRPRSHLVPPSCVVPSSVGVPVALNMHAITGKVAHYITFRLWL